MASRRPLFSSIDPSLRGTQDMAQGYIRSQLGEDFSDWGTAANVAGWSGGEVTGEQINKFGDWWNAQQPEYPQPPLQPAPMPTPKLADPNLPPPTGGSVPYGDDMWLMPQQPMPKWADPNLPPPTGGSVPYGNDMWLMPQQPIDPGGVVKPAPQVPFDDGGLVQPGPGWTPPPPLPDGTRFTGMPSHTTQLPPPYDAPQQGFRVPEGVQTEDPNQALDFINNYLHSLGHPNLTDLDLSQFGIEGDPLQLAIQVAEYQGGPVTWEHVNRVLAAIDQYLGPGGPGGGGGGPGGPGDGGGGGGDPQRPPPEIPDDFGLPGDPGVFPPPVQQVGQDPFSSIITNALGGFLQNRGNAMSDVGFATENQLLDLLQNGGQLDQARLAQRYETARELYEKARRTQMTNARGDLASRGLLSLPGIAQGPEITAVTRLEENLAPVWAAMLRDAYLSESEAADTRFNTGLNLATGLSQSQAQNFLDAANLGNTRQRTLSDIALGTLDRNLAQNQMVNQLALDLLDRNMAWNQFLAEYGLDRAEVMNAIQEGRLGALMPLIQLFFQAANMSQQGFV